MLITCVAIWSVNVSQRVRWKLNSFLECWYSKNTPDGDNDDADEDNENNDNYNDCNDINNDDIYNVNDRWWSYNNKMPTNSFWRTIN